MLNLTKKIGHFLLHVWRGARQLSGDDAYEQYLKHHAEFHAGTVDATPALSRKDFFKLWQDSQWQGVKRCC
jgi:uncharacterized short protein YbdD (DUF466 family)